MRKECENAHPKQILLRLVVVFGQPPTDWFSLVFVSHSIRGPVGGTWETSIDIGFVDKFR